MKKALLLAAGVVTLVGSGCATGITGPVASVGPTSANVTGQIATTESGGNIEAWVEYGPTNAYEFETERHTHDLDPGHHVDSEADQITGLERSTTYHYRVCASDSTQQGGPGCGEDRQFKTQPVACGETVTADIKLTGDLSGCGGPHALEIGADGVEINLGGYTLSGSVSPRGDSAPGIVNRGHDDVTVRNGTLGGFSNAFSATDATRNRLRNLAVTGLGAGASFSGGADNEVRHSVVAGALAGGVRAIGSPRFVLADSEVAGIFFEAGALVESDDARIVRNRFAPALDFEDRLPALKLTGSRAHIADNRVNGHWRNGFILAGANNVAVDNSIADVFGDGIFVSPFSTGVVLRRNLVDNASDDGIEVQANATRLEANNAINNGDWGIDATPGVTDLGGNTASGNGQPTQCRNLICS